MQDPVNIINNVGRNSYNVGQVQKCLFEALTTLNATMVRVNQDGKEASWWRIGSLSSNIGGRFRHCYSVLPHFRSVPHQSSAARVITAATRFLRFIWDNFNV